MTILSVEERQVRPCNDKDIRCVFVQLGQYHLDDECSIGKSGISRPENTYHLRTEYHDSGPDRA